MKIIVTSIGTRGDMEPLLSIGQILKEKGHEVICLFPEQFRELAESSGFGFASLGSAFIDMLNGPAGTIAMGGGKMGWKKMKAYIQLISMQQKVNKEMILLQEAVIEKEMPDRIVHNAKVMYPIIWALKHRGKRIWVSPVPFLHYVKENTHVAFNSNYGAFFNKLTYRLANFGLIKTISGSLKWLSTPNKLTTKDIKRSLFINKSIYTISPTLFQRPDYWPENIQVLGYHERKKTSNWKPTKELELFLKTHSKVILVTFGSMINTNPPEKTKIILDILERNKIPAIINTAAGGLVQPENYNRSQFHFVSNIPYDWICPRLYAMIHHGGSGTTHTAIKYGCASLIIPHIIDQYVWNKIIHRKGAGPLGIDVGRISTKKLEPKILDLCTNPAYKQKAGKMGLEMMRESFTDELYKAIVQ